jgi:hypothetical protein
MKENGHAQPFTTFHHSAPFVTYSTHTSSTRQHKLIVLIGHLSTVNVDKKRHRQGVDAQESSKACDLSFFLISLSRLRYPVQSVLGMQTTILCQREQKTLFALTPTNRAKATMRSLYSSPRLPRPSKTTMLDEHVRKEGNRESTNDKVVIQKRIDHASLTGNVPAI